MVEVCFQLVLIDLYLCQITITRVELLLYCVHAGSGWFCDKVVVRETTSMDSQSFYFPCGQWLDRGKSDGLIERTLLFQQPPELVQEPSEIVVEEEEEPETEPSEFYRSVELL